MLVPSGIIGLLILYSLGMVITGSNVTVFESEQSLGNKVSLEIIEFANSAIDVDGYFAIGMSGGSVSTVLMDLIKHKAKTDWSKWRFAFVDERYVPLDSVDSNYYSYSHLFSTLGILSSNILAIEYGVGIDQCAELYGMKFMEFIPKKSLHLVVLGMGPDGHTASLFPLYLESVVSFNLHSNNPYVAVRDAPKPPLLRISMTLDCINSSERAIFIIMGLAKSSMLIQFMQSCEVFSSSTHSYKCNIVPNPSIPASMIALKHNHVVYYLDTGAASFLTVNNDKEL